MNSFPKLSYACPIPWASLRGDERTKFCEQCGHTVTNLSELDETARRALLAKAAGERLCITYYRRLSGEFVTPESPLTAEERSGIKQLGFAALSAGALALAAGCMATPKSAPPAAPGYLSSPAATQKSEPATDPSSAGAEARLLASYDQNRNGRLDPEEVESMRKTEAKRNGGTEDRIVLQPFGIMVEETPKMVRSEIDHWIQAERTQEFPPGPNAGFSPTQNWRQFWQDRVAGYRANGFPQFKSKPEKSGEAFVGYLVSERQKFHLPALELDPAK